MSRRQRANDAQAGHTDDWLITYADTITLLLCLFVVLLALQAHNLKLATQAPTHASLEQEHVARANTQDWTPRIKPVTPWTEASADDENIGSDQMLPEETRSGPTSLSETPLARERTIIADGSSRQILDQPLAASIPVPVSAAAFPVEVTPQQDSDATPMPLLEIVARVQPEGVARVEQQGDRITSVAFDSTALFGRGSATLNGPGRVILRELLGNLKSDAYRDYMITIEGHTDDAPINTAQFPSNWELSTARAAAVVRYFVEQGMPSQRLRAAGYADTHPLQPNRDGGGTAIAENQSRNRRVVIVMEKVEHH